MEGKDRLKKALDSINEVLREVQRLQPSVPPLSQRVRNQLQTSTRKLKSAASEIEAVMRDWNPTGESGLAPLQNAPAPVQNSR